MFDIGGTELLVIAVVAIVVIGPKDLPRMLRTLGQYVGKAKMMAREFQTHFNEMAEESGLDEVRKGMASIEKSASEQFGKTFQPLTDAGKDVKREIESQEKKPRTGTRSGATSATGEPEPVEEAVEAKGADPADPSMSAST